MTDQSLRRADELLTELVEQVETARSLPMSSSCVLPRERVLDLLDELREVLPVEIAESRRVLASRDTLLHDAWTEAGEAREAAAAQAQAVLDSAQASAAELVRAAELQAGEIVEQGRAEHARLVAATEVHQAAARDAAQLRAHAEEMDRRTRAEADRYAGSVRADADRYAARLAADAEDYADRTLADLVATLQRATTTAEQGRATLAQRRGHAGPDAGATAQPAPRSAGDNDLAAEPDSDPGAGLGADLDGGARIPA